jgi:hypothetical protein
MITRQEELDVGATVHELARAADLGEASAINDAASRVGGVIAIVPALIGASGGRGLAHALGHGYQPAMIAMGGLCAAAARVTGLFVSNDRIAGPHPAPHPRTHGYALPVSNSAATS